MTAVLPNIRGLRGKPLMIVRRLSYGTVNEFLVLRQAERLLHNYDHHNGLTRKQQRQQIPPCVYYSCFSLVGGNIRYWVSEWAPPAARRQTPPLGSSPLASDKGQGGETLSDVTLPGDRTPFLCDVDYVLGDTMFSCSLEAAFEPETETRMQPRLTLHRMTADGLQHYSWIPTRSHLDWKKKGFWLSQPRVW